MMWSPIEFHDAITLEKLYPPPFRAAPYNRRLVLARAARVLLGMQRGWRADCCRGARFFSKVDQRWSGTSTSGPGRTRLRTRRLQK